MRYTPANDLKGPEIATATTFSCPACGQRFAWQPQYVGRSLLCKCGQLIAAAALQELASDSDLTYDLVTDSAPAEPPPARYVLQPDSTGGVDLVEAPPGAPGAAPAAQPKARRPRSLPYASAKTLPIDAYAPGFDGTIGRDFYFPIALIAFSTLTVLSRAAWQSYSTSQPFAPALLNLGLYLAWNVTLLLVGVFIAAKLLDTGFGTVPHAVLKLSALALGPLGVWQLVAFAVGGISGEVVGWMCSVPCYWWLFSFLFELDFRETFICVVLITLMKWLAFFAYVSNQF